MVFMPPRHGKSELVSRRLPAFLLGLNPNNKIIIGSYAASLANSFNADVKRIVESPEYQRLFPGTRFAEVGQGRRTHDFVETGSGGYLMTRGVGCGVTGMGMTFGVVDDPITGRKESDSPVERQTVYDWYVSDFKSRRDSADVPILITQTRWHRDDLSGRLLQLAESGEGEKWEVLCFPAVRGIEPNSLDPRKEGEPLWPSKMPLRELELEARADRRNFESLFQQNPLPDGGTEWPASFFEGGDVWFDDWPHNPMLRTTGIDPSKGSKAKAGDYSAIVKCAVGQDMCLYVEADLDRRHVDAIVERIIEIQRTFRPDAQAIEINGFQEWVADRTERVGDDQACFVPIVRIDNKDHKDARIRRLTPYLSMRRIRFKRNSPGTTLLVNQLRDFPNGEHDDGPDALEMAVRVAVDMVMGHADDRGVMAAGTVAGGY